MKDNKSIVSIVIALSSLVIVIASLGIGIANMNKKSNENLENRLATLETKITNLEKANEEAKKETNNNLNPSKNPETISLVAEAFANLTEMYKQKPEVFLQNGQVSLEKIEEAFKKEEKVKAFESKGKFIFSLSYGNIEVVFLPINGSNLKPETFIVYIRENTFEVKLKEQTKTNTNEIAILNNKFLPYQGSVSGSTLKALIKVWQEHTAKLEENGAEPEKFIGAKIVGNTSTDTFSTTLGTNFKYSSDIKNPNITSSKISELTSYIRDLAKYNITYSYSADGLITEINIEQI